MSGFKKRPILLPVIALLAFIIADSPPCGAQTLKAVKERGTLNCGVSQGLLGFSSMDDKNIWAGSMSIFAAPWRRQSLAMPPR